MLGVGMVGPGAGELIAEGVLAIEMGANATDLKLSIHPHPTLTETMMESAEVFFGQATHVYRRRGAGKVQAGRRTESPAATHALSVRSNVPRQPWQSATARGGGGAPPSVQTEGARNPLGPIRVPTPKTAAGHSTAASQTE